MEIKRERVAALLAAGHKVQDICKADNVGKTLVYKVNTLVKNGRDLNRKSGSGRPANMEQKAAIVATVMANGLKIGTEQYLEVMKDVVKPCMDSTYPDGNYVWEQDSAPAHKAKKTHEGCKGKLKDFWPWQMWPPSSQDLAPLDYGI
ncbi:Uncharacterized protein FKW44_005044 [Caligus rogercresseyi]|uniref:Tc1-like transposase DDE domain-containing protein n=2 Tax=Caligus rogercresseyi TaxID=217165 RepID=A0A7T8KBF2_CALRO|nr:Uncharacterized protein FKW44_016127 [Caligus rogercresseyi]QQP52178.1 Uncharacterized protein FKW44_004235 [Caligus rogercresseyi]QQP52794.1 Uncharacterized protein FKW44_005044 [Caligus rogercresseyi]